MTVRDRILAIDIGTQSTRAILHDRDGNECGIGSRRHVPLIMPEPGTVEQDTDDLWASLVFSVQKALENQDAERIAALALTSQRSAVIAVDRDGIPLHHAVSWLDQRIASQTPLIGGLTRTLLDFLPEDSSVARLTGWARPNILAEYEPEVFARVHKWLTISGWVTHRLTGRFVDAPGSISGVWPFDSKAGDWMTGDLPHQLLGFGPGTLPELVPAGSELGTLLPSCAQELGLPAGLPIISVGGDKQAEALGGGITASMRDIGGVSLGTGASVYMVLNRFHRSAFFHYLTNSAAEPGRWVNEYMVLRGFWMVSWFVREFAAEERLLAQERDTSPEALLSERALEEVPAGSNGLIVLPRFTAAPDVPRERGAFLGFTEEHGRLSMFRAILEGIGFDLRRGLAVIERATGRRARVLRAGGGGARSDLALQATASILGRPLEIGATQELSALGASICAAAGIGWYSSWEEAAGSMTRVAHRIEPDPGLQAVYDEIYRKAFYPALSQVRPITAWLARRYR